MMSIAAGTAVAQDLTVCAGKGYTLNSTAAAPPFGATSYSWYEDGKPLDGENEVSLTIPAGKAAGTYAYWRMAANEACPEGIASNTFTVRVSALPAATVTAKTVCSGKTVALSATLGAGTTTPMTYTWNIRGTSSTTSANSKTSQALTATTTYTVQLRNSYGCVGAVSAPATITVHPAFSPGTITTASTTTAPSTAPTVTIQNITPASGGNGNITYQWRRTGTSSATLTGTTATYTLSRDAANYNTAGTYYFNRYAHDATCNTAWLAATGTYTLVVEAGTITLCPQCCYNGAAWVNCYVTTNAYPFDNDVTNTPVQWSGNGTTYFPGASGSGSDKNGRKNFDAITASSTNSTSTSAVGLCKALGDGWYLPAYEELVNMSSAGFSSTYPPLNGLAGAKILTDDRHWSSTEYSGNLGRFSYSTTDYQTLAVIVSTDGYLICYYKTTTHYVRCAKQE
jgi:hypothetical protein